MQLAEGSNEWGDLEGIQGFLFGEWWLGTTLSKKFKNSEEQGFMGNYPFDSFEFMFDTW